MNNQNFADYDQQIELPDGKQTSFAKLLLIDKDNLSREFAQHAAWLGYIGVLTAEAEAEYETAKLELETIYAEVDSKARLAFNRNNTKFTEAMVHAFINLDEGYIAANRLKLEKLKDYKTLKAIESAMKEKGNMLISLGATMRQELDVTSLVTRSHSR